MTAIKNCAFGQPIPVRDRSASSAKYKVGERVKFVDEDCVVSGVTETLTGRWLYNIERNGVCIAVGVTENMLDPAEEAGK
jgi:hypothetical protein